MRIVYRLRCDFNDTWTIFRDEDTEPTLEESICPHGHQAVTIQREWPSDEVAITLRPAARLVDRVRNQVVDTGKYWLVVTARDDDALTSQRTYTWSDVLALAERFQGQSKAVDWARWESLDP